MAIYSYLFGLIIACVSYVVYEKYYNVYSSLVMKPAKRYDYIIVGAGTAGCVLASRLSEDPKTQVLLIEAGDRMGYFSKIPLMPTASQQGPDDWSVRAEAQRFSSFGLWDQSPILPRGKGLGGSGQINFLLHGFGLPEDYDRWADLGFKDWTLKDLKPYFIKAFGTEFSEFDSEHCSAGGFCSGSKAPMKLKLIEENNELMNAFRQASNMTEGSNILFRRATATVKNGMRHSTFDAYLKPAMMRKNLHVLLKTNAVSIRFEDKKASSVYILQRHRQLDNIFINKEVIISAGAVKTPQLLMLSGVGPRALLKRLKIQPVLENDYVGQNLHDHMNLPLYVSIKKPISITLAKIFSASTIWNYAWKNAGLLSFPPVAGVEYQYPSALMLFSMGTASERLLRDLSNYKQKVYRETFPYHNDTKKEGFMFLASCVQPRSRGSVNLSAVSTAVPPIVDVNYLSQSWDVRCMTKAVRRAEQLIASKPFRSLGARIHWPRPERCLAFWNYSREDQLGLTRKNLSKDYRLRKEFKGRKQQKTKSPPDEYIECIIREVAVTGHHAGGTCAGATVVDDQLRVIGTSGIRIIDASVFPAPVSLFPNSVLVAMAERAAEIVRNTNA